MASPSRLPSIRRPAGETGRSRPLSTVEGAMMSIPDLAASIPDRESSKRSKRLSLLPQFARKTSSEERQTGSTIKEEVEVGTSTPSPETAEAITSPDESNGRSATDEDRKAMPPPSRLSRPTSIVAPRGTTQYGRPPITRSHTRDSSNDKDADADTARAQSLAALTGDTEPPPAITPTVPDSDLKRTGSTRLPQSSKIGPPSIPSRTTSSRPRHAHGRATKEVRGGITTPAAVAEEALSIAKPQPKSIIAPSPLATTPDDISPPSSQRPSMMSRPRPSSHMPPQPTSPPRPTVISTPRPPSQVIQPTSPPRTIVTSKARPSSQVIQPASLKPAFNTFQQHYSPAKSALPKAPIPSARTSSKRTTSTVEPEATIDFEATKQQIELLQLSLLHQSANKCLSDYTASARRKLGKQHTKLRKDYESIRATELVHQRASNLAALEAWCPDPGLLVENLQILSLVYSDLSSLLESGSRHHDVVDMFELWMDEAEVPSGTSESGFVQPLPDDWKAAHASVMLKLRGVQRNIRVLPSAPVASSGDDITGLEAILKGCKLLVEEMLKELEVMGKLEKEVLARERLRVEEEVKALIGTDNMVKEAWVPAWQKVS